MMTKIFSEFSEQKWEQVRTHPYYAKHIEAVRQKGEEMLATEPPRVKFSDWHLFKETGDRSISGKAHGEYSARLEVYFFLYLLDKDQKWLTALADIMWNICDFETWTIPAHVSEEASPEDRRVFLDLCSSITGYRLAEILYFIGDDLPDLVKRRVAYEVKWRIIDSYKKHCYWWEKCHNNWASVCAGAVFACHMYMGATEDIKEQLPYFMNTIQCYLDGFQDDGCCTEGYGYWNYGFSYFCLFADMLRVYTDGETDLFKLEKVHTIAQFQQNIALNEKESISFSDAGLTFSPQAWLTHYLKKQYPDLEIPHFTESNNTSGALRYVLWQDPEIVGGGINLKSFQYKESQWFVSRHPSYTLACKAGHNAESHNHNDVGSFIISKDGKVSFVDPGTGAYTRQYFGPERYEFLSTSSRGHSVPIINGQLQVTGKRKSEIYLAEEHQFSYSIENGYAVDTLKSLTRSFDCAEEVLTLTDTYCFTEMPQSVVERFVSYYKPEITEAGVRCGTSLLCFDKEVFEVSLSSEMTNASKPRELFMVDLKVKSPAKEMTLTVQFK